MRKYAVILSCAIMLASAGCTGRNEPSDGTPSADTRRNPGYLYDIDALPEITISLTEDDWNTYLTNYDRNKHNDLYVPARWTFSKGGEVWRRDSIGLRPRGNSSRRRPEGAKGQLHNRDNTDWHHAHFGIHFTEYATGQRFFGSDRLVLKWFHGDPAYCREIFCYDLFRRFKVWTAPRASYCRLWLHIDGDEKPAYFGVYAMIEGVRKGWIDDRMKDGFLPDNTGNMWKAAYNINGPADLSDFQSTQTSKMGISDDTHDYSYALKTNKQTGLPAAKEELFNFMEKMRPLPSGSSSLQQYIGQHIDVDVFLRALAVNVAVGMWDDYWVNANNYYFYFDSSHRFYFIPYDYDNTLGTSKRINGMNNAGTQDPLNWGSREGDRLLVRKVLSVKEYEDRYKQYLKTIVTSPGLMEPDAAIQRIRHFQHIVENYVANDTGEDMNIADLPRQDEGDIDYRLLSGDDSGGDGSNFFRTKAASVSW